MKSLKEILKEFDEKFGAVFSFPPMANNATAHIKGVNGKPQAYAGRYDNHDIKQFIIQSFQEYRDELKREVEGRKKTEMVNHCGAGCCNSECEIEEGEDGGYNQAIADILKLLDKEE